MSSHKNRVVVRCTSCGQLNRVASLTHDKRPVCGKCRNNLVVPDEQRPSRSPSATDHTSIEEEIHNIKARLDRIEAFLSDASAPGAAQHEQELSYELVDLQVKKSESILGPEYAYRLKVMNSGRVDARFIGRIIFLDSSEFEVDSQAIDPFTVPAGQTFTKTGKASVIDKNHAARIADVTAELNPI